MAKHNRFRIKQLNLRPVSRFAPMASGLLMSVAAIGLMTGEAAAQADIFAVDGFEQGGAPIESIDAVPQSSVQAAQATTSPDEIPGYDQALEDLYAEAGLAPNGSGGVTGSAGGEIQGVPQEIPLEQLAGAAEAPSPDDLFLQSLEGGNLGQAVAPQGVAGAASFIPLSREDILVSKPSTLFIDSSDGTYHPELAQCQLIGEQGSYDCTHVEIGQFYAHAMGGSRVVRSVSPNHPNLGVEGAAFNGDESYAPEPEPRSGFAFSPYVAVRGGYALADAFADVSTSGGSYTPTPDNGYGGSLAVGTKFYQTGNIAARVEGEAAYRQFAIPGYDGDPDPGNIGQLTAMANLYVDYLIGERFVVSAGAGAGAAQTSLTGVQLAGTSGGPVYDGSEWSLAYQGMIGAGFRVTPNLTVFGELRRIQVQDAISEDYLSGYTSAQGINEVAVGVRLALGGGTPTY